MLHFGGKGMKRRKEYNLCKLQTSCAHCANNEHCEAWENFVLQHNATKFYAHFDVRVSLAMPSIRNYVMNEDRITTHRFHPFIYFQKKQIRFGKEKKLRDLYYCSHLDRCVYQRYAFLINQKYNQHVAQLGIEDVAIAYRSNLGKNNIDFAQTAFDYIREKGHCLVIVSDFTKFFDKLNHDYLKSMLCGLLEVDRLPSDYFAVFKNITHFSSWDWKDIVEQSGHKITERGIRTILNKQEILVSRETFRKNNKRFAQNKSGIGIPQGSPISAILSNVYMLQADKDINEYVAINNGKYMRYSDDFLVILPYESESKIHEHKNWVLSYFQEMNGLVEINEKKTFIHIYNNGTIATFPKNTTSSLDYLGFVFDGLNVKLRPKTISKYHYRMRRKARHIGRRNWVSPQGKIISAKNLYKIYSSNGEQQTFIDYAKRAKDTLKLNDPEANAVIKHHKRKIAHAIKSGKG